MTKDTYYPLETNMLCDERIIQLTEIHGMYGLGVYTLMLSELRKRDNYSCGANSLRFLSRAYQIDPEILESVINDFNLFEHIEEDEKPFISSPYLNRVMEKLDTAKSAKAAPQKSRTSTVRSTAAITANRANNGRFTVTDRPIKEKKTKENTTTTVEEQAAKQSEEQQPQTTVAAEATTDRSEELLTQALNDSIWWEVVGMQSGMGELFIRNKDEIITAFLQHVKAQGTGTGIHSVRDVKSYVANFLRPGTPTHVRLFDQLKQHEKSKHKRRGSPHEEIDPQTGARSYCGQPIPSGAPPRPNANAVWDTTGNQWLAF